MTNDAPYTVLFVDDEPGILKSMARLFRESRFNILLAESGEAALEILRSSPIEVLITDYRMPGMSGLELLRATKSIDIEIVKIMISGHSDLNVVLAALNESDLFRFVTKPWNDLELKVTVSLALAHRKLIDEKNKLRARLSETEVILAKIREQHPEIAAELIPTLARQIPSDGKEDPILCLKR